MMKNLPVFLSLSILLAGFGLFFSSSIAQAAPGDVELNTPIGGNYARHLVRIGDYIYVMNRSYGSGIGRVTKIDKNSGAVVANFNTCVSNFMDYTDMETDGTYLWVNEKSNIYSGNCNAFNRPGGYSAYGLTKIDPSNGNILQRIWFTGQSKASAYDGAGYIWVSLSTKLCKVPVNDPSANKADNCFTYSGYQGLGQITESDGSYIYVHASKIDGYYLLKIRQSDGASIGSVVVSVNGYPYEAVRLKGSDVWVTERPALPSNPQQIYKVTTATMFVSGPYSLNLATVSGEGWGQSNIASEGSCLWVGGIGQTGSLEETLSILNSSGAFIKKINVDPGTGNNKLYDVLYDAAAQKMWVSAEGLGNVYRLDASGCPSANTAPNVPTRVAPGSDWSNNPSPPYIVNVTDPDAGDVVHAHFDFASGPTDGDGSAGAAPHNSTYTPTTPDGEYLWRAKSVDDDGAESAYAPVPPPDPNYWIVRKDTAAPVVSLTSSKPTPNTARWDWSGTTDALSGLRSSNTYYRDVDAALEAQGYVDAWTTATFFNTGVLPDGTYRLQVTAYDSAGNSATSSWVPVTISTTGTIAGYVWNDTNTPNCVLDATGEDKITVDDDGDPLVISISETGQSAEVDPISEGYVLSGVAAGTYTVCVTLPDASWVKRCPTTNGLCESNISVTAGTTTPLNFGLRHEVDSWYRGGVDGDVHTDGLIDIPVPNNEYFVTGSGVVTADDGISTGSGDPAESTWVIGNYSAIGWPSSLIDGLTAADTDMTGAVHVKVYDTDLTITTAEPNWSTYFHSSTPTIVVAPNITIASDVGDAANETINTILIAKNTFTVNPLSSPPGNQTLQIKGAVIAKTVTVNRELNNNGFPAMEVEFDPRYFLYTVPYFTQATHSWSEVR